MKKPPLYDAFKGWRYQTGKPSRVGMDELRQAAAAGSLEPAADCSGLVYLVLALGGRQVPELGQVALMAEEFPRTRAPGVAWVQSKPGLSLRTRPGWAWARSAS